MSPAGSQAASQTEARFANFYRALHEREPYRWQCRLAALLRSGGSERLRELVAPTGAGKTTLIECFLFALGEQLEEGHRDIPLRLFWVIDRRSVADQVFAHAEALVDSLENVAAPEVDRVRTGLRRAAADPSTPDQPLVAVRLWRGGTERGIERVPLGTPAIVCSTVDQVGSRLLFRGYGTAPRSRPVDAAVVGTDSLIVLDEAHLSQPFADTVNSAREIQLRAKLPVVRVARLIRMTATPAASESADARFELKAEELDEEPLAQRVRAKKHVRLEKRVREVSEGLSRSARRLAREAGGSPVVGVVANTVADARAAHDRLRKDGETLLLIGPSRPLDRAQVLDEIPGRTDPRRSARPHPLFVVGTQTLEVGLDLDFDACVSAAAPFASLVQRFGRLDRAGEITREKGLARGAIVISRDPCPVYGDAAAETFAWLASRAENEELDLGPDAIATHMASDPPTTPVGPRAPMLAPWHLEALVQTNEEPIPSPEVDFFLHGEEGARDPDVTIVWRCDLDAAQKEEWEARMRARPTHPGELLSLPVAKARRWLRHGRRDGDFGDIESAARSSEGSLDDGDGSHSIPFGRVTPPGPDGNWGVETGVSPKQLRPGDLIVVPSKAGGCDRFGWEPNSSRQASVPDLGDLNAARPRILLGPQTALGALPDALRQRLHEALGELVEETIDSRAVYSALNDPVRQWILTSDDYQEIRTQIAAALGATGAVTPLPVDGPSELVLTPRSPRARRAQQRQGYEEHVERVVKLATAYSRDQDLERDLSRTVERAARFHDVGKRDPRFQGWLNRGVAPEPGEMLAKSDTPPNHPRSTAYRVAAGWPRGKRHEMTSAVLVQEALATGVLNDSDPQLLVHLIAVHHGQLRPFFPGGDEQDPARVEVSAHIDGKQVTVNSAQELDFGEHAERFQTLNDRYGPWGLAALEATLVLADRLASAEAG